MPRSCRWMVYAVSLQAAVVCADFDAGLNAFEKKDYALALKEWVASARTGDANSLKGLGRLYAEGLGVPQDLERAHLFFNLAAFKGDPAGGKARDAMEKAMAPEQIQRAKNQALDFVEKSEFVPADVIAAAAEGPAKGASRSPVKTTTSAPAAAPPAAAPAAPPTAAPRPAIELSWACQMQTRWEDKGSGGKGDLGLHDAAPPPGSFAVGGYAQGNYRKADGCVAVVRPAQGAPAGLIAPPRDWHLVWTDKGSGARSGGAIWVGVPPTPEHVCLGAVPTAGEARPTLQGYGCVHRCLTRTVEAASPIWTDEGTGAEQPVALWRLPLSNSFVASATRDRPAQLLDLDPTATCAPRGP